MKTLILVAVVLSVTLTGHANLAVSVDEPKPAGDRSLLRIVLRNSFNERMESARATLFLLDEQGKPVEQITRWVIGGGKDRPPLASGASTIYNFVIAKQKPFATTKLVFSRIVLEGGKLVDVRSAVVMEQ